MKNLLPLLTLFLASQIVWADDIPYVIKQENSVLQIQTELQTLINGATANDRVVVTGSKTDADITLTLQIAAEKKVVWQAVYQSSSSLKNTFLISFSGSGCFEVADGELITENAHTIQATNTGSTIIVSGNGKVLTSGTVEDPIGDEVHAMFTYGNVEVKDNAQVSAPKGEIIASLGDNATIIVSGGSVTTTIGAAIITIGKNAKVFVSGGYVSNEAGLNIYYPAIYVYDPRPNTESLVHVSGSGKVEAKGYWEAVITSGNVIVSGDARVNNTFGGTDHGAAIDGYIGVEIRDNAIVSSQNYTTIRGSNVTLSGNCLVEAKGDNYAIYAYKKVEIKEQAQVIAEDACAISQEKPSTFTLSITGGAVFAYGYTLLSVINQVNSINFAGVEDSGIILAWNKEAGNTTYEKGSNVDIFKTPEDVVAYWDKKGNQHGIYYENGNNTGFIPIENVTVEEVGIGKITNYKLRVYPNPTTGQLTIDNGQLTINKVEIFDVSGRKVLEPPLTVLQSYDLTVLHPGIYFLRVGNDWAKVVKQ